MFILYYQNIIKVEYFIVMGLYLSWQARLNSLTIALGVAMEAHATVTVLSWIIKVTLFKAF